MTLESLAPRGIWSAPLNAEQVRGAIDFARENVNVLDDSLAPYFVQLPTVGAMVVLDTAFSGLVRRAALKLVQSGEPLTDAEVAIINDEPAYRNGFRIWAFADGDVSVMRVFAEHGGEGHDLLDALPRRFEEHGTRLDGKRSFSACFSLYNEMVSDESFEIGVEGKRKWNPFRAGKPAKAESQRVVFDFSTMH